MTQKQKIRKKTKSLIPLFLRIVGVYYLILISFIGITLEQEHLGTPLSDFLPIDWFGVIRFVFYGLPVLLAFMYGLVFRPFWPNFRNLLTSIIVVHGIYSIGVFAFRAHYFEMVRNENHKARVASFRVFDVERKLMDQNQDGQVDALLVSVKIDADELPAGDYVMEAKITQSGATFPESQMGRARFTVKEGEKKIYILKFQANPQVFEPYYENGLFGIDLSLGKMIEVNKEGRMLLAFSRWSPFVRLTTWQGQDPEIEEQVLEINKSTGVDSFEILPLDIQPKPVIPGVIRNFGVDRNNNGRFEAIMIQLEVVSKYSGPVFFQAMIEGSQYPLIQEKELSLGNNTLEFVIGADEIKKVGKDGPYKLIDVQLFSRNPQCVGEDCLPKIKEDFTIYLNDYETDPYRLSEFE